MDEWIVIAKFLDMDITSIIVTKGQQRNINILENYFYEKDDVEQNPVSQKRTKGRPKKYDGPYKTSKDFRDKALYNEFTSRQLEDCKIRSVEEFLNYLPLVAPLRFADFMRRIWGNLYDASGRQYMYKQMDRLIKSIPESDAKVFADQMTDYCLTKPVVTHTAICVVNDKIEQEKFEKYISYIKTEAADVEYEAYKNACEQFSKGIAFLDNVKLEKF